MDKWLGAAASDVSNEYGFVHVFTMLGGKEELVL